MDKYALIFIRMFSPCIYGFVTYILRKMEEYLSIRSLMVFNKFDKFDYLLPVKSLLDASAEKPKKICLHLYGKETHNEVRLFECLQLKRTGLCCTQAFVRFRDHHVCQAMSFIREC